MNSWIKTELKVFGFGFVVSFTIFSIVYMLIIGFYQ